MPIYSFINGTDRQKELWREGPAHMLNLPVESLPLSIAVEFVAPEEIGGTTLAETFWTYGSQSSHVKVRNDYPAFGGGDGKLESLEAEAARMGLVYSTAKHAEETPVHELGHSMFAALSAEDRLKVVELFGGTTDSIPVINNPALLWQDRIAEAIAETFKEAFLPSRFRVFPNRTNLVLSYKDYPEFRRLFRGGQEGSATNRFCYLYGSSSFRVDLSMYGLTRLPYHRSDRDPEAFVEYQGVKGFERGWGVQMDQFPESGKLPFSIESEGVIS